MMLTLTLTLLVLSAPSTFAQVDGYLQNRDPSDPPRVDIEELQRKAFIMEDGEAYRDLLTIGASQAVAEFALRHERTEKFQIARNKINSLHAGSHDAKFFSKTLSQPKGQLDFDKFHFPDSRRIQISAELAAERILADRDEIIIVNSQEARDTAEAAEKYGKSPAPPTPSASALEGLGLRALPSAAPAPKGQPVQIRYSNRVPSPFRTSSSCRDILGKLSGLRGYCYQSREHSVPTPTQPLGNYASVQSGAGAYSHRINFGSPSVAASARYVRLPLLQRPTPPHPVAPVSVAPLSIHPQSPSPLDYGYGLNHGKAGGSYASYTHG